MQELIYSVRYIKQQIIFLVPYHDIMFDNSHMRSSALITLEYYLSFAAALHSLILGSRILLLYSFLQKSCEFSISTYVDQTFEE